MFDHDMFRLKCLCPIVFAGDEARNYGNVDDIANYLSTVIFVIVECCYCCNCCDHIKSRIDNKCNFAPFTKTLAWFFPSTAAMEFLMPLIYLYAHDAPSSRNCSYCLIMKNPLCLLTEAFGFLPLQMCVHIVLFCITCIDLLCEWHTKKL